MEKHIGFCGINCSECRVYMATIENNLEEKRAIAYEWSTEEFPLTEDSIKCYGCCDCENRVISFAADCDIRVCGIKKEVKNCGHCEKYSCELLKKPHEKNIDAKELLDDVHARLKGV